MKDSGLGPWGKNEVMGLLGNHGKALKALKFNRFVQKSSEVAYVKEIFVPFEFISHPWKAKNRK